MVTKELLKQLIVSFQNTLPASVIKRETTIPLNTGKIITFARCTAFRQSSIFLLTINELLRQGVPKERILYINFDDERLIFEPGENDKILEAYRELFPEFLSRRFTSFSMRYKNLTTGRNSFVACMTKRPSMFSLPAPMPSYFRRNWPLL